MFTIRFLLDKYGWDKCIEVFGWDEWFLQEGRALETDTQSVSEEQLLQLEGKLPVKKEHYVEESSISAFMHCAKCLDEMPSGVSPREWARLGVGWTKKGLQIWCNRHDMNVYNLDFKGQKVQVI